MGSSWDVAHDPGLRHSIEFRYDMSVGSYHFSTWYQRFLIIYSIILISFISFVFIFAAFDKTFQSYQVLICVFVTLACLLTIFNGGVKMQQFTSHCFNLLGVSINQGIGYFHLQF